MASTQLSTIDEAIAAGSATEKPSAQVTRGFWGTLRWRAQNIFWNYMGLQAQMGLYGSTDEYGDT